MKLTALRQLAQDYDNEKGFINKIFGDSALMKAFKSFIRSKVSENSDPDQDFTFTDFEEFIAEKRLTIRLTDILMSERLDVKILRKWHLDSIATDISPIKKFISSHLENLMASHSFTAITTIINNAPTSTNIRPIEKYTLPPLENFMASHSFERITNILKESLNIYKMPYDFRYNVKTAHEYFTDLSQYQQKLALANFNNTNSSSLYDFCAQNIVIQTLENPDYLSPLTELLSQGEALIPDAIIDKINEELKRIIVIMKKVRWSSYYELPKLPPKDEALNKLLKNIMQYRSSRWQQTDETYELIRAWNNRGNSR